jgi:hypothetical protein
LDRSPSTTSIRRTIRATSNQRQRSSNRKVQAPAALACQRGGCKMFKQPRRETTLSAEECVHFPRQALVLHSDQRGSGEIRRRLLSCPHLLRAWHLRRCDCKDVDGQDEPGHDRQQPLPKRRQFFRQQPNFRDGFASIQADPPVLVWDCAACFGHGSATCHHLSGRARTAQRPQSKSNRPRPARVFHVLASPHHGRLGADCVTLALSQSNAPKPFLRRARTWAAFEAGFACSSG